MSSIIDNMRRLNSKERFFLINYALGSREFPLSAKFCEDVANALDLGFELPPSLFSAMDYHLDWLFASLRLASPLPVQKPGVFPNEDTCIEATQEDIDFIIAFEHDGKTHIILLEAKGVTGWTNKQLQSKKDRLVKIFGEEGTRWPEVVPHFAIVSPQKPIRLDSKEWPAWMKTPNGEAAWIRLPGTEKRLRVHRCDNEGKESKDGRHWTTAERKP